MEADRFEDAPNLIQFLPISIKTLERSRALLLIEAMQDLLDQMVGRVLRHTDGLQRETMLPRVGIGVMWPQSSPIVTGCGSGVCLVLQGAKQMIVGSREYRYLSGSCFASVIELPTTRSKFEYADSKPYVATSLKLDDASLAALIEEMPEHVATKATPSISVTAVSRPLLEAWDHHLALLDMPEDIPMLHRSRERELLYRLLQSDHGPLLRQIARRDGRLAQVRKAIDWLRQNFNQTVAVRELAEMTGMSVPSFNRHFRAATATSPLQYQKTLRLQAARRILSVNPDATHTAYAVGYESSSQFSREYARLFGAPPRRDAAALRDGIGSVADIMM